MRPPNLPQQLMPVRVLRLQCKIRCPTCSEGIGFLHVQPIEPHHGIEIACPKCKQKLGIKLDCVNLGKPTIVRG
jgi:hypothetical protein